MATRTNIHVYIDNMPVAQFYRHLDGYPTGTGLDLAQKMLAALGGDCRDVGANFIKLLTDEKLGEGAFALADIPQYEPETFGALHADIDWFYRVTVDNNPKEGGSAVCILACPARLSDAASWVLFEARAYYVGKDWGFSLDRIDIHD